MIDGTEDSVPISAAELDFLRGHAGPAAAAAADFRQSGDEHATTPQPDGAATSSLNVPDAAAVIGVAPADIVRLIAGKSLWAFNFRDVRRIPRWQILGGTLLPGLDVLVPAVPAGAAPAAVDGLMRTVQPDFDDRTPIEYLAAGGDPAVVAGFLADLGRW